MALVPCSDLSPADWITDGDIPWERLATFGPAGFPAYARMLFIPDPSYEGQSESDAGRGDIPDATALWQTLLQRLRAHTSTPDDGYFGLWEGWSGLVPQGPRFGLRGNARFYYLFRGPLSDVGQWGAASPVRDRGQRPEEPAFVWPADRAWCVSRDVDPHWAGIGAEEDVIERLTGDERLDVLAADPAERQPFYR